MYHEFLCRCDWYSFAHGHHVTNPFVQETILCPCVMSHSSQSGTFGVVSGFCSIEPCPPFRQSHSLFFIVVLQYASKSGNVMSLAVIFFLKMTLAVGQENVFYLHVDLRIALNFCKTNAAQVFDQRKTTFPEGVCLSVLQCSSQGHRLFP